MATYSLDLDFRKPDPKFPGPPNARIFMKKYSSDENFTWPIISARCQSFAEIDHEIKQLENDLKAIRQKAKQKFGSK